MNRPHRHYRVNATRDGPWRMLHVPALGDYVDACGSLGQTGLFGQEVPAPKRNQAQLDKQRRADASEARARAVREANANAPDTSPAWAKGTARGLNEVAHVPVATGQREKDNKAERIRKGQGARPGRRSPEGHERGRRLQSAADRPPRRHDTRIPRGSPGRSRRQVRCLSGNPEVKVKPGHYRPAGPHFRNLKSVATMSDEDILDYAGQLHARPRVPTGT